MPKAGWSHLLSVSELRAALGPELCERMSHRSIDQLMTQCNDMAAELLMQAHSSSSSETPLQGDAVLGALADGPGTAWVRSELLAVPHPSGSAITAASGGIRLHDAFLRKMRASPMDVGSSERQ